MEASGLGKEDNYLKGPSLTSRKTTELCPTPLLQADCISLELSAPCSTANAISGWKLQVQAIEARMLSDAGILTDIHQLYHSAVYNTQVCLTRPPILT